MSTQETILAKTGATVKLAAFIIIIAGFMAASSLVTPLMMALFIAIICVPALDWLGQKGIPDTVSVLIVIFSITLLLLLLGTVIGESVAGFSDNADTYEASLKSMANSWMTGLNNLGFKVEAVDLQNIINPAKVMSFTAGALSDFGGFMSNSFVIFFVLIFLLMERQSFQVKATAIREDTSGSTQKEIRNITNNIRHYLSMKTIVSLITGFLIWLCLIIIGVDYAILWALIAFLFNFIPNIGSIIAAVPAVLLALVQLGPMGALWTLISYLAVNMVMGNIVEPRILGQGLGISTLVVFLSLIFWGYIFGTVGMFLAVPLTLTIKLILAQSSEFQWVAILLGTEQGAQEIIDKRNPPSTAVPEDKQNAS